jgi:hypothetical protein
LSDKYELQNEKCQKLQKIIFERISLEIQKLNKKNDKGHKLHLGNLVWGR